MRTFTFTGNITERNAKQYCSEDISLIENYVLAKADNFKGWCIHHRLEFLPCQNRWVSKNELLEKGLYFNRPAWELLFMRIVEHRRLHSKDQNNEQNLKKAQEAARNSEKRKETMRTSEKVKQNIKKAQESAAEARRKPFTIDNIRYETLAAAANHFGVGRMTISRWLNGKLKTKHICKYI